MKIILISGPSCVGKGPLLKALGHFYPDIGTVEMPIIRSHESRNGRPRSNETGVWNNPDYFLPAAEFGKLDKSRFFMGGCRGYPQAIDTEKLESASGGAVLMEVYHSIGAEFKEWAEKHLSGAAFRTVFIMPLSEKEIAVLKAKDINLPDYVENLMMNKQLARAKALGQNTNDPAVLQNFRQRAKDAYTEMQSAKHYTDIIVNHDGEGHTNWNIGAGGFSAYPEGDAGKALKRLADILRG